MERTMLDKDEKHPLWMSYEEMAAREERINKVLYQVCSEQLRKLMEDESKKRIQDSEQSQLPPVQEGESRDEGNL